MQIYENEDAQFMLLAGFIIAIGLVIATVMLNSIIFEGNMAGETGTDPIKYDLANLRSISSNEMKSAYRNATNVSAPNLKMINNFTNQTQNFSVLSRIYAIHGEIINVSFDISNWNNTRYANFTEDGTSSGASNWTVIENAKNATIKVNVSNPGTFQINVSNNTKYWLITPGSNFDTSITNFTPPYSIVFINGAGANGNYRITGNTTYGRNFTRARDYVLYSTIKFSTGKMSSNITFPVTVPW